MIEVENLSMSYGDIVCLSNVSLGCAAGSIHAVTGENGAGKSTLMKIIGGVVRPNAGTIRIRGREVVLASPRAALAEGVSTVFQEFSLIENLSLAESLCLGHEPRYGAGVLDRAQMLADAQAALAKVGLGINPRRLVSSLTVAEQQMVEIARGVFADADVFIFDEPTAALGGADVARLKALIRDLQRRGKAIFYISHRLDEIFDLCDTVSVLKDGRLVRTLPIGELSHDRLVSLMVGREMHDFFPPRGNPAPEPLVSIRDLVVADGAPPVAFDVRPGEILGLAGLEGQGQREILRAMAGVARPKSITMRSWKAGARDHDPRRGVRRQIADGIAFVPEDRKKEGLYLGLPIAENIALGQQQKKSMWGRASRLEKVVADMMKSLHVRASGPQQAVGRLSGGNQQKVMLGRWLVSGAWMLLIEEPTRGVDVGAKAEIYGLLRRFVENGGCIVVSSREMNELIGFCDRILVVRNGQVAGELAAADASEEAILHLAIGAETARKEAA